VCIIGEQEVGKTKIMRRFVLGSFDPASKPTIGVEVSGGRGVGGAVQRIWAPRRF